MTSTSPRLIIGLTGYLRSGKDTAGAALIADGFTRASFADKIRAFLHALNPQVVQNGVTYRLAPIIAGYGGWEEAKDQFPEVRALLQRCGADAGRTVLGDNVWVDAAMRELGSGDVVFTDVRFPNEAEAIQAAGGFIIRVTRPGHEPGPDAHESETAMDGYPFDFHLPNIGGVSDLCENVRSLVRIARSIA